MTVRRISKVLYASLREAVCFGLQGFLGPIWKPSDLMAQQAQCSSTIRTNYEQTQLNEPPNTRTCQPVKRFRLSVTFFTAMIVLLTLVTSGIADEYKLNIGDVIELSVADFPDLKQRVAVGPDGKLSLQVVGDVEASNISLSELRQRVRSLADTKQISRRTPDGRTQSMHIPGESIVINIVEFRPIYLIGDVSKPGEYPYRPGLTVRQAIAAAGGYGPSAGTENPFIAFSDLRAQRDSIFINMAQERERGRQASQLLKQEFGEDQDSGLVSIQEGNLQLPIQAVNTPMAQAEKSRISAATAQYQNQVNLLKQAIASIETRKQALRSQRDLEEQNARLDAADSANVKELFAKNLVPISRVAEQRRIELLSATRVLQTQIGLDNLEKDRSQMLGRAQELKDQRRTELITAIQESNSKISELRVKLTSVIEKMSMYSRSSVKVADGDKSTIRLSVFRPIQRSAGPEDANGDTLLQPGDVVEITVQSDQLPLGIVGSTSRGG